MSLLSVKSFGSSVAEKSDQEAVDRADAYVDFRAQTVSVSLSTEQRITNRDDGVSEKSRASRRFCWQGSP